MTVGLVVIITIASWTIYTRVAKNSFSACAADTQLCPDGSFVNRTGPQCVFAKCPQLGSDLPPYTSGILGSVSIGPICPVMKNPPNTECVDRPYATTITVHKSGSNSVFTTTLSTTTGAFKVDLPAGTYSIQAGSGKTLPRCTTITAIVAPHAYATTTISCDTGIR